MSKLPQVKFADDTPSVIECVSSLASCIVAGEIVGCASDDPANMIRIVGYVTSEGAERFLQDDPDGPRVFGDGAEMRAWMDLADSLGVQITSETASDGMLIVTAQAFPWKLVLGLAMEALKAWLASRNTAELT